MKLRSRLRDNVYAIKRPAVSVVKPHLEGEQLISRSGAVGRLGDGQCPRLRLVLEGDAARVTGHGRQVADAVIIHLDRDAHCMGVI